MKNDTTSTVPQQPRKPYAGPKIRPIRFCTGGCANGPHHAHFYDVDPVDGPLRREYLCPGNLREASEFLDDEGEGEGYGIIEQQRAEAIIESMVPDWDPLVLRDAAAFALDGGRAHDFEGRPHDADEMNALVRAFSRIQAA